MAAGSSSCSPVLLILLLSLASASAGAGEASTTSTSARTPSPAPALDQVYGRLGSYYVTTSLCASALCGDASSPCRAARDAPAVAALAARLATDNATAARDSIEAVFSPSSSSGAGGVTASAAAAGSCLQLYVGLVPALRWARAVAAGCEGIAGDALPRENGGFADMSAGLPKNFSIAIFVPNIDEAYI